MKFHMMIELELPDEPYDTPSDPAHAAHLANRMAIARTKSVHSSYVEFATQLHPSAQTRVFMIPAQLGVSIPPVPLSRAAIDAQMRNWVVEQKPAPWWLNRPDVFRWMTPLQVVVCAALLVLIGWLIGIPNKP